MNISEKVRTVPDNCIWTDKIKAHFVGELVLGCTDVNQFITRSRHCLLYHNQHNSVCYPGDWRYRL